MSNARIEERSGTGQKQHAPPTRIGQGPAVEPRRPNPPRTLDGYQIPFPKPTPPPPRSNPPLKAQKTAGNRVTTGGPFAQKTMPRTPSNLGPGRMSAVKTGSPATRTYGISNYSRDYDSSPSTTLRTKSTPQKSASRPQYGRVSYPMTTKTASVFPAHQTPRISSRSDSQRRHSMNPAPSVKKMVNIITKTTTAIKPLWQQLDNDREEELLRRNKRDRDGNVLGIVRRMHPTARRGYTAAHAPDPNALDPDRPKAEIMPKLRLRVGDVEPEDSDSNDDEPRYRPQARLVKRKSESLRPQAAVKRSAARKVEYIDTSSDSEISNATQTMGALSDQSQDDQPSEHDELASSSSSEDVLMEDHVSNDNVPEIVLLDNPSRLPIPINPDFIEEQDEEPLEDLVAAVEALSLPAIRMQKTYRLPFLLRNVRQGFFNRCRKMQIPIYSEGHSISFSVRYEHVAGAFYRTKIESWCCPLCDILGAVKTREILDCHLRWDHPEVYCEWQEGPFRAVEQREYWELRLLIPEIAQEDGDLQNDQKEADLETGAHTPTEHKDALMTPTTRNALSPFPSVTLSPPSATRSTTLSEIPAEDVKPFKLEIRASENDASLTPSIRSTPNDTSSQTRSTTAATGSSRPVVRTAQHRPSFSINPLPPPPDNPLGPAAQRPYLPAESDYGGPTVYYSCRPGGECLFDLLGTLPMEPFGLLDWEVIDREEEIYESDEVKEEYKVMHALWARWIMLNRNKFISNYFRGVMAFVDQYWKFIHKAAGWDALRYWLFILLGNQFLSGREVAKVLLHYEGLTDMAHWYD